jgi:hypothetical protein
MSGRVKGEEAMRREKFSGNNQRKKVNTTS